MPIPVDSTRIHESLNQLQEMIEDWEQLFATLPELRRMAAIHREMFNDTACYPYWQIVVHVLDALIDFQVVHEVHHGHEGERDEESDLIVTDAMPTIFGVTGRKDDDGNLHFDFHPEEPA